MKFRINIITAALLFFFLPFQVFSQEEDIQREVRVVKPYTPTLSDAQKIDLQPVFTDTLRVSPDYNYSIFPKRFESAFRVKPIQPARMIGLPLDRLYKSQLSLGLGNYLTPFIELNLNQLRSRKSSVGLYFRHLSSDGNIKLENGRKVDAGYSDNLLKLFGKKMYYRSVLEGGITGGYNSFLYYGYNPAVDTLLFEGNIKQKIYSAGADIRYYSSHPDSVHFNYDLGVNFMHTSDFYKNAENNFQIKSSVSKFIGDWYSGLDLGLDFYGKSSGIDSFNNRVVRVNPWTSKASDQWKVVFGLNAVLDLQEEGQLNLYPKINFEFNIVDDVLIPYFGLDGKKVINNYRKIIFENPYIVPGLSVANTSYDRIAFLGLKGRYSSKMSFDFQLSYTDMDSMYYFVNDTTTILQNQFDVAYDYTTLLKAGGEITWHLSESMKFHLSGNYYHYKLENFEHPWHMPSFDATLQASYNLREKILVDAGLFYTGKRYARGVTSLDVPVELKPYLDANLGIEYRYTNLLSFFLKFRNLSASRYEIWKQYPVQRFQAMAGFTYSL